jgi:hypothetical protein
MVQNLVRAIILAVCVGNRPPLAVRSISTSSWVGKAIVQTHLMFLDMVFVEPVKGFPDRPFFLGIFPLSLF